MVKGNAVETADSTKKPINQSMVKGEEWTSFFINRQIYMEFSLYSWHMYILFSFLLCLLYELVYCLTAGWRGIYWENWRWWTPWPSGWICVGMDSTFRYSKPFNLLSVLEEFNLQTKYDIKIKTRFYPFQRKMKVLL